MKKYLILFVLVFSLVSTETTAQSLLNRLNRAVDGYRQRSQQRTIQRNNSQQTYQNRQRYEQQERANQQRRDEQQREYMQQQERSIVNDEDSRNETTVRSDANNTTQGNDKVVSLVANGTGSTKEEATKNALRSAIEQAFGTFVSANTEVLNDELVKDEIVTVSTGNIKTYNVLSSSQSSSGLYDVSVHAIVSIDQLTKFAQSKGMQTELAGASFVMNMKMRELNKKNEVSAIAHMIEKAEIIAQNGLFDYKLEMGEPKLIGNHTYEIGVEVFVCENENTKAFYNTIYKTLDALSLSEKEQKEYEKSGLKYYTYNSELLDRYGSKVATLRNKYPTYYGYKYDGVGEYCFLLPLVMASALNYTIQDNLGNQIYCVSKSIDGTIYPSALEEYISKGNKTCAWFYIDKKLRKCFFFELSPKEKIAPLTGICIPIHNRGTYNSELNHTSFNPIFGRNMMESTVVYYHQRFKILYSEEELSKLKSITIIRSNK